MALLRGINLGGRHRITMGELARVFTEAGAARVETLIQSGNVAFEAAPRAVPELVEAAAAALRQRLGTEIPVIVRSVAELAAVTRKNPFLLRGEDPERLHVAFLREKPAPAAVAALDPGRSKPDAFVVQGREIYLCLPHGVARTRLTNDWFDRSLDTKSTLRNWRTTLSLLELASR